MARAMRTGGLCLVGVLQACNGGADADPELPRCCTDATCAAAAQKCNTTSCTCENIACARPAGEPELCPAGAFCKLDDGVTGLCTPSECQDFFTGVCGAELGCRPQSSDAYACEPVGEGGVDEPCLGDVDCAYGLLCADERCLEPDCSPVSDVAPCVGGDKICRGIVRNGESLDVGLCVEPCTAFYGGGCTGVAWCWPDSRDGESGRLDGHCVTDEGALSVDMSCTSHRDCDVDLGCFGPPGRERCRALCDWQADPGDPGSCEVDAECLPLLRPSGSARDYGYCTDGCRAFLAGECPVGDWCFPELRNNLTGGLEGSCLPGGGSVAKGGSCAAGPGVCRDNLVCVGWGVGATCRTVCDAEAAPDDPGDTCSGSERCADLYEDVGGAEILSVYGACVGACDYDALVPCSDSAKDCIPHELGFATDDICLETPNLQEFQDCTSAGLAEQDYCNVSSACYELYTERGPPFPEGTVCYELCRTAYGPFEQTGHPDCSRGSALCLQIFDSSVPFGVCAP